MSFLSSSCSLCICAFVQHWLSTHRTDCDSKRHLDETGVFLENHVLCQLHCVLLCWLKIVCLVPSFAQSDFGNWVWKWLTWHKSQALESFPSHEMFVICSHWFIFQADWAVLCDSICLPANTDKSKRFHQTFGLIGFVLRKMWNGFLQHQCHFMSELLLTTVGKPNNLDSSVLFGNQVHCRVFHDNSGALEIANNPKFCSRTKHINQRHHFFRSYVGKHITMYPIATKDQVPDIFTKPLPKEAFNQHHQSLHNGKPKRECKTSQTPVDFPVVLLKSTSTRTAWIFREDYCVDRNSPLEGSYWSNGLPVAAVHVPYTSTWPTYLISTGFHVLQTGIGLLLICLQGIQEATQSLCSQSLQTHKSKGSSAWHLHWLFWSTSSSA